MKSEKICKVQKITNYLRCKDIIIVIIKISVEICVIGNRFSDIIGLEPIH